MASSNDDDFQVVFSIKAVLHAEEEVDCSLKTTGDLFSTMSSATTDTLKDFSASLVQAIRSPIQCIPQGKFKLAFFISVKN